MAPSRFIGLPAELRNVIYELAGADDDHVLIISGPIALEFANVISDSEQSSNANASKSTMVIRSADPYVNTCKQMYSETSALFAAKALKLRVDFFTAVVINLDFSTLIKHFLVKVDLEDPVRRLRVSMTVKLSFTKDLGDDDAHDMQDLHTRLDQWMQYRQDTVQQQVKFPLSYELDGSICGEFRDSIRVFLNRYVRRNERQDDFLEIADVCRAAFESEDYLRYQDKRTPMLEEA